MRSDSSNTPRYGPPDASLAPRYTGIRTFARCPYVTDLADVDVGVVGVPFDTATSFRPGARFGPEAIRASSALVRPWHPQLSVDVFAGQSVADTGDIAITPGNAGRTLEQVSDGVGRLLGAGVTPIVLGGDHSIVLGELRAHAARNGPVPLILLDAHADIWDSYYGERYFHGTPFRRACEEGLIDAGRSVLAGMRGPLYAASDLGDAEALGFELIPGPELEEMAPDDYARAVKSRLRGAPAFVSFDIDVIDPASAPGTGTPEVAGLTPSKALKLLRSLAGIEFLGFDLVEVSPAYDNAGQVTSLLAANVIFEFLALRALGANEEGLVT